MDKCAQSEYLLFRDAWCTQERVIRFTTPFFREYMALPDGSKGRWETGDIVMYEVNNDLKSFVVNCVFSLPSTITSLQEKKAALFNTMSITDADSSEEVVLHSWDLTRNDGDVNKLLEAFDQLISRDIPSFEEKVKDELKKKKSDNQEYTEGSENYVLSLRYERNPNARAACLAAHGTACVVCGMDFGKVYGPEFSGKIEVHHVVPISQIGREYVVDPVKDLVPVCPNCHTALHSKKNGVYTIEELKVIRNNSSNCFSDKDNNSSI